MKFIITKNYDEMSEVLAKHVMDLIKENPELSFCLPAGGSPIGMYEVLVREYKAGNVDFSKVHTYNMDEYIGLEPEHHQSYAYFANHHLLNHVNIDRNRVTYPLVSGDNVEDAVKLYRDKINALEGIDIAISGVGDNGHVAFNEPNDYLKPHVHLVNLDQATIQANSRFFDHIDEVPRQALTIGIADFMMTKNLFIVASGKKKAPIFERLFENDHIDTHFPVSFLRMHPNCIFILDEDAASLIKDKL